MIDRYNVTYYDRYGDCGVHADKDNEHGEWIQYDDYIEEKDSNVANPLLGEVLDDWITDLETEDIYMIPKLLEKMKKFKESISL